MRRHWILRALDVADEIGDSLVGYTAAFGAGVIVALLLTGQL